MGGSVPGFGYSLRGSLGAALRALSSENVALRAELEAQWRENHFEHCGRTWPHAGGERCMWPPPELLNRPPEAARPVPTEDEPG